MNVDDFEDILYEKEDNGICTITINRPERRNAVTYVSFLEIFTVLEDMEKDKDAKVLIITGNPEGNEKGRVQIYFLWGGKRCPGSAR